MRGKLCNDEPKIDIRRCTLKSANEAKAKVAVATVVVVVLVVPDGNQSHAGLFYYLNGNHGRLEKASVSSIVLPYHWIGGWHAWEAFSTRGNYLLTHLFYKQGNKKQSISDREGAGR